MSKRWSCESCGETYKTKRELLEHLQDHIYEHHQELQIAKGQMEDLGIKEYKIL